MTDAHTTTPLRAGIQGRQAEAQALLKKRYRSEWRFRALGLSAIIFAALAVVVLIGDIIIKGIPAFTEHQVRLPITFSAEAVDPQNDKSAASFRNGDYQALIREALRARFPEVTARLERRKLEGIVSTGATDELRARLLADPSLLGKTATVSLILSDDADLFLKGQDTKIIRENGTAELKISRQGDSIVFEASSPVFAKVLAEQKALMGREAARIGAELARIPRTTNAAGQAALNANRAELEAKREALLKRVAANDSSETFGTELPSRLIAALGGVVHLTEIGPSRAVGTPLRPLSEASSVAAGQWALVTHATPEGNRKFSDLEITWVETLRAEGAITRNFAWRFFTNGDSREPELAGIRGALFGSALTLFVTLVLCLPIGVGAAVYLEEFAPKNRLTDILEVNINNLAAVPSIVFGLLGLAMFLNVFGLPRSAPLVGGLVLALLVLPTIIIASRAALKAVPPSIKEAALGVGASHQQAIFHHVLPLAMPGIMTGTIIGMAHALGETAPLLMIGMVAFIVQVPGAVTDAATVLPVQIYLWSDLPEAAFQAKTAGAILVLLAFLILMNGLAILLRRRFERRW